MAVARVYVGAHYPGDVVAGLALGAATVTLGGLFVVPVLESLVNTLARSWLRPVLCAEPPSKEALAVQHQG